MKTSADRIQILRDLKSQSESQSGPGSREAILIFSAIALVAVILFLWAVYIRKPKRQRSSANEVVPNSVLKKRHSQDRHSRKSKRRNPTLAETGGLPPRKQECVVRESL